jgi:putative transposase
MAESGPQWEVRMKRKRYSVEQIIGKLREAEVLLSQGRTVKEVSRALGATEQTYYRWRKEYGGLEISQARRLMELGFAVAG